MKIRKTLRFKQVGNQYALKGATNTTEFKINELFTKKEVDKLIEKGFNCNISSN